MTPEDAQAIRQGMEAAQRQLVALVIQTTEVLKQAAQLIEQQHALRAYIAQAASVLGESMSVMAAPTAAHDLLRQIVGQTASQNHGESDGGRPLWREAAWALSRAQRPLTVPEIVDALRVAGKQLTGDNITEVLRVAMNRKLNGIFETVSRGRYALKAWPAEWKARDRQDSHVDLARALGPIEDPVNRFESLASLGKVYSMP